MRFTMVYQFQNTMVDHGIPCVLPWFTSFKIPWYTMRFTMVYQFQNTMVYHAFYHGLPVSKYHGRPWYIMRFTMVYYSIPWVLPWFTSFKIPWYTMVQFTMVQIYHGTIVPWYNVAWYTMVLFHKGLVALCSITYTRKFTR